MTLEELFKREFLRGYRTGRGFKETFDKDLDEIYNQYLFDNPDVVKELELEKKYLTYAAQFYEDNK